VQATLLVLILMSFFFGCLMPKGSWRWALIISALLPAIHVTWYLLHGGNVHESHPYFSRFMIVVPAFLACLVGVYSGVFLRFIGHKLSRWFSGNGSGTPSAK
jgi:phosphotransferase system  glucose/maltose/N-acetylglucosamine-specific IIC component